MDTLLFTDVNDQTIGMAVFDKESIKRLILKKPEIKPDNAILICNNGMMILVCNNETIDNSVKLARFYKERCC